jgi:hypothetical protein
MQRQADVVKVATVGCSESWKQSDYVNWEIFGVGGLWVKATDQSTACSGSRQ